MTTKKTHEKSEAELRKEHTGEAVKPGAARFGLSGQTSIPTTVQCLAAEQLEQIALARNATSGLVTMNRGT